MIRYLARRFLQRVLERRMIEYRPDDRNAIVFSPHPDDEVLGCGGTVIRKRQAGARVVMVYMTDGARSHNGLIDRQQLAALRANEALAASQTLGIDHGEVILLDMPDGELAHLREAGALRVAQILEREQPVEVYTPYFREEPEDHWATTRIVRAALRQVGRPADIFEYPVWFMNHCPWVALKYQGSESGREWRDCLGSLRKLFTEFNRFVRVGPVLNAKRAALARHRSQVERLVPDPRWKTLSDVSAGEFLECFFTGVELFHRYQVPTNRSIA